jgi:transposase
MGFNFLACDRDQQFLMPPNVADWLPEDHLAWFMIDVVSQFDVSEFCASYRADGRGGAAFDPQMMVTLLVYSYAVGERSSRKIEQACVVDVAYRVVVANQRPDHTTIARFRKQHSGRLEQLLVESVRVCAESGLGKVGTIAIDGRKVGADAALDQNRTREAIEREVRRWLAEADAVDAAEDARYGADKRGDEVPAELADPRTRRARLAQAKAKLDAEKADAERAHAEHLAQRARIEAERGSKLRGRKPKPPELDERKANVTDPDSRIVKTRRGFIQGYNAQAVATEDQIVIAAEVMDQANDHGLLHPMLAEAERILDAAGITDSIDVVLADAGYYSDACVQQAVADNAFFELLMPPDNRHTSAGNHRDRQVRADTTTRRRMRAKLQTERAKAIYKKRGTSIEPVFGQHHTVQRFDRFSHQGHDLVNDEWKLVNAAHNLKKAHTARLRRAAQRAQQALTAFTPASLPI